MKINETLPWIELEGIYQTKKEAKEAAEKSLNRLETKIVELPTKKKQVKALATIRTAR
jgi:phage shock protein A